MKFAEYAKKKGFVHRKICPLNPEANGAGERFIKVINKAIRCAGVEKRPWKNVAGQMLRNYRATPHSATNISPDFMMFETDQFNNLPSIREECDTSNMKQLIKANDDDYKQRMKYYADEAQNAKYQTFKINDPVMYKWPRANKFQSIFDPHPYKITEIKGNMIIAKRINHTITRNSRFFKKISNKCLEHAMSLMELKQTETLDNATTLTFKKKPIQPLMDRPVTQLHYYYNYHH